MQSPINWLVGQLGRCARMSVRWHLLGAPRTPRGRKCRDTETLSLFPELDTDGAVPPPVVPEPENASPTSPTAWMISQLTPKSAEEPKKPANPRPPGVLRPGSGSDVLLRFLQANKGRWFFHQELVQTLGRSKGEVDWALQYLARLELIDSETSCLPGRKPVMRYSLGSGRDQQGARACEG